MEQILVVGPAWVGDMVLAQSLFKTLKLQLGGTGLFQGRMTLPVRQILKLEQVASEMSPQLTASILELIAVLGKNVTTA